MHERIRLLDDSDLDAIDSTWISVILFATRNDPHAKYAERTMVTLRHTLEDGKLEHFLLFGKVDVQSSTTRLLASRVDETLAVVVLRLGRPCETFVTQSEVEQGLAAQRFREVYGIE